MGILCSFLEKHLFFLQRLEATRKIVVSPNKRIKDAQHTTMGYWDTYSFDYPL